MDTKRHDENRAEPTGSGRALAGDRFPPLGVAAVAEKAGIPLETLAALRRLGTFPQPDGRLGRTFWWYPATVQAWMNEQQDEHRVTHQTGTRYAVLNDEDFFVDINGKQIFATGDLAEQAATAYRNIVGRHCTVVAVTAPAVKAPPKAPKQPPVGSEPAATMDRQVEPSTPARPVLSRREAASRLGIGLAMLAELTATNAVPSLKIGKRRLYRAADLEAWLDGKVES